MMMIHKNYRRKMTEGNATVAVGILLMVVEEEATDARVEVDLTGEVLAVVIDLEIEEVEVGIRDEVAEEAEVEVEDIIMIVADKVGEDEGMMDDKITNIIRISISIKINIPVRRINIKTANIKINNGSSH